MCAVLSKNKIHVCHTLPFNPIVTIFSPAMHMIMFLVFFVIMAMNIILKSQFRLIGTLHYIIIAKIRAALARLGLAYVCVVRGASVCIPLLPSAYE